MKLSTTSITLAGVCSLAGAAQAQVMTEVRISTASTDEEYIEILGTPGQSTDGLMILNVEGDPGGATGGAGTLDRAYDLSVNTFPDEYFVFGSVQADAAFPGEIDLAPGDNLFENSSITIYLVSVPDPVLRADIIATWVDTDITDPVGSLTTRLASDPGITILDAVGITDGDMGDMFYDGAPVFGPDGNFLPAGVFRNGGCPGDWCTDFFLNFGTGGGAMAPYVDPTPGSINPTTTCMTTPSAGTCGGAPTIGTNYCQSNPNSTGVLSVLTATGSVVASANNVTLTASSLPPNAFGFFLASRDAGFVANPGGSEGNLCLAGSIGRYVGPGQIMNGGAAGEFSLVLDLTAVPQPTSNAVVMAGETWRWQTWHRDLVMGASTSNFTNGLEIDFQ